MLHYHALHLQCSQADTQVLCGKPHNSKDHDDSTIESRARAIAPHLKTNPRKGGCLPNLESQFRHLTDQAALGGDKMITDHAMIVEGHAMQNVSCKNRAMKKE